MNLEDGIPSFTIEVDFLKGAKGDTGFSPRIEVASLTSAEYILRIINEDGEILTPNLKGDLSMDDYVLKEEGMGLSRNSFEDDEKQKLQELQNYDDTEIRENISKVETNLKEEIEEAQNSMQDNLNQSQQDLLDDMSKTYTGTNITAPTVEGYGRINKVWGHTIEEGTGEKSPTNPYTLRCVGDDVNLFDKIQLDNNIAIGSSKHIYLTLKPNTKYTLLTNLPLSTENTADMFLISGHSTAGSTQANGVWNKNSRTIVSDNNGYLTIGYRKQETSSWTNLKDYKYILQEGTEVKEGYGTVEIISQNGDQQSSNVVVTKPLCCLKDGDNIIAQDYIDYTKGVVHRECEYRVLDGTEDWQASGNAGAFYRFGLAGITNTDTSKAILCSHFRQYQNWDMQRNHILIGSSPSTSIWIMTDVATTVQAFKAWLASNPVTFIYQLATAIEEPIDCSNKIVQYSTQTTVSNRDGAEIEVSLTNNEAIAEVNGEFKNNEIQTITNENGTAIKFPNGMSICSFFGERATGSTYGDVIWNYPMPFKEAPVVLGLAGQGENYAVLQMMLNSPGTNMAVVQFLQNNSYYVSKKAKFSIVAIGRWK